MSVDKRIQDLEDRVKELEELVLGMFTLNAVATDNFGTLEQRKALEATMEKTLKKYQKRLK